MTGLHYIGLDVHKKTISFCAKLDDGRIVAEGTVAATISALTEWVATLPQPWCAAMEATLFTGWIYDFLRPYTPSLTVAHPAMLKAISASKKKNDRVDARKIADLLRANLLPACYMAPSNLRELRRLLRFRTMMVHKAVCMQNKTAGLMMESGVEYNKEKLHQERYFTELLTGLTLIPESVRNLARLSHDAAVYFDRIQRSLVRGLLEHPLLKHRVELLRTIPGVGEIVALTWALETGEVERFSSIGKATSYAGLTSAQVSSAGKEYRAPISKQRNKHLQTILVEAAKLAPRWNASLEQVHQRERAHGNANRATLAVARKLVAYLMAVDRSGKPFVMPEPKPEPAIGQAA